MTKMSLTDAKQIADSPSFSAWSNDEVWKAYRRLLDTEDNGGVRNSERAQRKLDQRIARLEEEIKQRGMTAIPRLSALFPFGN